MRESECYFSVTERVRWNKIVNVCTWRVLEARADEQ